MSHIFLKPPVCSLAVIGEMEFHFAFLPYLVNNQSYYFHFPILIPPPPAPFRSKTQTATIWCLSNHSLAGEEEACYCRLQTLQMHEALVSLKNRYLH